MFNWKVLLFLTPPVYEIRVLVGLTQITALVHLAATMFQ